MNETNYTAHILDDSAEVIRNVRKRLGDKYARHYAGIYSELRRAIKFRLPEDGRPLRLAVEYQKETLAEFNRLPYPSVALEYRMSAGVVAADKFDAPERVLLCMETGNKDFPTQVQLFIRKDGLWCPFIASSRISSDAAVMDVALNVPEDVFGVDKSQLWSSLQKDLSEDSEPLAEFLAALACSNVETQDTAPPNALNRRRGMRGKTPFFTYKTLVLKVGKESGHGAATGGHASPRIHLRRGHIRRLPDKRVWVNACVVGDKSLGMVAKDYAVQ